MWEYLVPLFIFLIISVSVHMYNKSKEKQNLAQDLLPAFIISIAVFVFIKYRDTWFAGEPMMGGNYFDN